MNKKVIPRSLCMVHKDGVKILNDDLIDVEKVGVKGYGLSKIPPAWTLPFFVISSEMYEMYISDQKIGVLEETWYDKIIEAMRIMKFDLSQNLFIRSNMCIEDMTERGQFESYECNINELFATIKIYFDEIMQLHVDKTDVPILLQQYSQVLGRGHVSNEKRLSKENRDWKGEIEQKNLNGTFVALYDTFTIPLRNWRRKIIINEFVIHSLNCSSLKNVSQVLEIPCTWATKLLLRIHYEWIYDGKFLYIVQADEEQQYGINPMIIADSSYLPKNSIVLPEVLHILSAEDKNRYSNYSKVLNPLIYNKLGLKTSPIYILEDKHEIKVLSNGKISKRLSRDLNILVKYPLVIRIDVDTDDISLKQMLPRTDDIRNINDAIDWLIKNSREIHNKYADKLQFIFIFHNFIPAFASAFAYANPDNRNVLIESLWGVPEGLYYYSHDKYIADTHQRDFSKVKISEVSIVQKKINAKNNFIFPDSNGKWNYNQVSTDYIWKPVIPKASWIKEIAFNTRKISEYIGAGVSVMWFVGVNSKIYECDVLPWHHEQYTYNVVPKQSNRKKHWNESKFTVSRKKDLDKLNLIKQSGNLENIKYLLFKPIEESMIRNKEIIEEVGKIAKELSAVIILEGGVLSHAYYQLKHTGAAIEVNNTFDSIVSIVGHDKLVRDKIPNKIRNGGEIAVTKTLSDNELFEQLRIKLVEESFEVLEAENVDDLVQELADVLEVIDSIIEKQKIRKKSIDVVKNRKKEKAGGFEAGIVLKKTAIPVYNTAGEEEIALSTNKNEQISSWVDKKEITNYKKIIKRIKIPVSLKQWNTQLAIKGSNKRPDVHIVLNGRRSNANLQIEIIISEELLQLMLFNDHN